jgi:3'-phosphoadenosine 5'-phosphosulfate sulfotransferase (PAPS reductase)/FAD synthetase
MGSRLSRSGGVGVLKKNKMQLSVFEILQDISYSDDRVMVGLSGGINSMAALCYLATMVEDRPDEIYLYYAHFDEHSPDTERFVLAGVEYAKKHFNKVVYEQSQNSILSFFKEQKMIPQPKVTPCTRMLKIAPMVEFMKRHKIDKDIVGYVRHEWSRINRQIDRGVQNKDYLIRHLSDEDCFSLVKKEIGWYPEIYRLRWDDLRIKEALLNDGHLLHPNQYRTIKEYSDQGYNFRRKSYRVFKHNNCLPCKNMHQWELYLIKIFYPNYYDRAIRLAKEMGSYWGRQEEQVNENSDCAVCAL